MKKFCAAIFICIILSSCGGTNSESTIVPTDNLITPPPSDQDRVKAEATMDFNGRWSGFLPDESGIFYMVIDGNDILMIDITGIPGCGEYMIYFHEPQYVITGNTLSLNTSSFSLSGTFEDENTASGEFEINHQLCDGSFKNTWNGEKGTSSIKRTQMIETISMPENKIPESLFQPKSGTQGFGNSPLSPYSEGDWDLSVFVETMTYVPVPRGWTVIGKQNQLVILSFQSPSPLTVTVGILDPDSDEKSVEEALADIVSQVTSDLLSQEVIDSKKGYMIGNGQLNTGENVYDLVVISKDPSGKFNYFRAVAFPDKWEDYFPIVQDMVGHWSLMDGTIIGVSLPDKLIIDK